MADLIAQLDGFDYFKLADYNERTMIVKTGVENIYNGALLQLDLGTGHVDHLQDDDINPFIGIAKINNVLDGVAAGESIKVVSGIAVGGLTIGTGTPGIGDIGRPMYAKTDDHTIADWTNAGTKKKLVGHLASDYAGGTDYSWLRIPGCLQEGLEQGATEILVSAAVTDTLANHATGLGEVVQVLAANVKHGETAGEGSGVRAKASATAGAIDIEVFDETAAPSGNEVDVEILVRGFLRAVMA
jgi:hypothetical protein